MAGRACQCQRGHRGKLEGSGHEGRIAWVAMNNLGRRGSWVLIMWITLAGGCALRHRPVPPGPAAIPNTTIELNQHLLTLHFSRGVRGGTHLLLVYATGDGGWHRKD